MKEGKLDGLSSCGVTPVSRAQMHTCIWWQVHWRKLTLKKKKKGLKNPVAVFKITESPNGIGWKEFLQVIMSILPEQTEKSLQIIYQKLKM